MEPGKTSVNLRTRKPSTATVRPALTRHEAARWMVEHPQWSKVPRTYQEVAVYLALNEYEETTGTLMRDSLRVTAERHRMTRDKLKHTLTALRQNGLAWSDEQFLPAERGTGNRQHPSLYYLALDRTHVVSPWRQRAAAKGLSRPAKKPGKIPFSPSDDAALRRYVKRRDTSCCEGCGQTFTPKRAWARFCTPKCRVATHRLNVAAKAAKP